MQDKCCSCGGQHRVTYGDCEVMKGEIEQVKAVNNISYAEAVKRVQGQRGRDETDKVNQFSKIRGKSNRETEKNTALTVDKMI